MLFFLWHVSPILLWDPYVVKRKHEIIYIRCMRYIFTRKRDERKKPSHGEIILWNELMHCHFLYFLGWHTFVGPTCSEGALYKPISWNNFCFAREHIHVPHAHLDFVDNLDATRIEIPYNILYLFIFNFF